MYVTDDETRKLLREIASEPQPVFTIWKLKKNAPKMTKRDIEYYKRRDGTGQVMIIDETGTIIRFA